VNEAELVYSHVLECDRLSLYLNKDACLDKDQSARVSRIFKRRLMGQPLQYILGSTEFMGLEFKVDKRALIPRPETEVLVSCALERLKLCGQVAHPEILDLGTGSGCIAVSIAKLLPQAKIWATDISVKALQLAEENADLHKVKISFFCSDLFKVFQGKRKEFDLIISNPPYICEKELSSLAREISFEPILALGAGVDGLDFYRRIISQAPGFLKTGGFLILEMGFGQQSAIESMLKKTKNFEIIEIIKDYNNIERVLILKTLNPKS
jgi:release factor glutamine methyltransferase